MPTNPHRPPTLLGQPFRGSTAVGAGLLTSQQLRGSAWRRLFRDVYVDAAQPDSHLLRVQAAALILPAGAVIAGRSAAHLWGCPLADAEDEVEVLAAARFRSVDGLHVHVGRLRAEERTTHRGIPVTTPIRAGWDIARSMSLTDAIGWIDALARRRRLDAGDLCAFADLHRGERHALAAKATLALCDPLAESVPESRLRVGLLVRGLPPLVPQHVVCDNDGYFLARVDLAWPAWKFAIEYDGVWHASAQQLTADRRRIRGLNAAGWFVYPVTAPDMHDMDRLARSIQAALQNWIHP